MSFLSSSSSAYATLSDSELVTEIARLAGCERHATAQLIASLAELDARRLYLGEGCSSMFNYSPRCCVSRSMPPPTGSKLPAPHGDSRSSTIASLTDRSR